MNADLIWEGLLLPPAKRNILLIMKRLDRSIFLTPHLWSWYRRLFLFLPEACGRSSNRLKPKYERGMLTGGSEKD